MASGRTRLDGIGDRHDADGLPRLITVCRAYRHNHSRLAFVLQPGNIFLNGSIANAFVLHQARVADDYRLTFQVGADAKPADGTEFFWFRQG